MRKRNIINSYIITVTVDGDVINRIGVLSKEDAEKYQEKMRKLYSYRDHLRIDTVTVPIYDECPLSWWEV